VPPRQPTGAAHLWRARSTTFVSVPASCSVTGCDRPRKSNGLCNAHDHRRRRGTPLDTPLRQYRLKGCAVAGCGRPHAAHGFCYKHWHEDRNGAPSRRQRTPAEIDAIRALHTAGMNMTEISRRFNCSRNTVMRIVRGLTFQPKEQ